MIKGRPHDRAAAHRHPTVPTVHRTRRDRPIRSAAAHPTLDITFVGHGRGEVRAGNGMLGLVIDSSFEDLPAPDVIVFPGGVGTRPLQSDARVLDWVRVARASTTFTTSGCTGSLVLGAAGLPRPGRTGRPWAPG